MSVVRLLDLVEQQHRVGLFGDRLGQQTALFEADITRRRAIRRLTAWRSMYSDMSKADQLDAHAVGELARGPRSCRRRSGR